MLEKRLALMQLASYIQGSDLKVQEIIVLTIKDKATLLHLTIYYGEVRQIPFSLKAAGRLRNQIISFDFDSAIGITHELNNTVILRPSHLGL